MNGKNRHADFINTDLAAKSRTTLYSYSIYVSTFNKKGRKNPALFYCSKYTFNAWRQRTFPILLF
jgi:hypothetical protein